MSLSLAREFGQRIRITCPDGTVIWVELGAVKKSRRATLRIDAPPGVRIVREELLPASERKDVSRD